MWPAPLSAPIFINFTADPPIETSWFGMPIKGQKVLMKKITCRIRNKVIQFWHKIPGVVMKVNKHEFLLIIRIQKWRHWKLMLFQYDYFLFSLFPWKLIRSRSFGVEIKSTKLDFSRSFLDCRNTRDAAALDSSSH